MSDLDDLSVIIGGAALDHPIALAIGPEAAARLAAYMGGEKLYVPMQAAGARRTRDDAIRAQHREGYCAKALAQDYRLCERQIRTILAAA